MDEKLSTDEVENLLKAVSDPEVQKDVDTAIMRDPIIELRTDIFDFFRRRLEYIDRYEAFKVKVRDALEDKIEEGEIEFNQLMQLFKILSQESSIAAESIVNLFKPVPGAVSPLSDSIARRPEADDIDEVLENLSKEEIKTVNQLFRLISEKAKEES